MKKHKVTATVRINGDEYRYAGGGCPYCTNGFLVPSPWPEEKTAWGTEVYRCLKCARRFVEEKNGTLVSA